MATHSIASVVVQVSAAESRGTSTDATGKVAETRQVVAGDSLGVQAESRELEMSPEALEEAVSHLKEYVQSLQRNMDFSVDDKTGRYVVRVVDSQTQELIRQIPSEEMLAISRNLADFLEEAEQRRGFLVELKA
ncbi:flagellar protein FlaG [Thiohalophilus sp.]|uniref:flagellar protein FlaG n=1 Tax=Thiohalophilus sp. TaxID=3028392 RepID=UPI002ACE3FF1|nr:flagellar protein FlaG [Thiohalophilus sp.]MDZ7802626.1 flagellar protein FlaG [Thiohalophilus sp.]